MQELIGALESGTFQYAGSRETTFKGIELRSENAAVRGRIYVYPDTNWPRGVRARFRDSRRGDSETRIRTALSLGAAGFAIPRSECTEAVMALLEGSSTFIVEDTHAFAWAVVEAFRNREDSRLVTAVTGAAGKSTTQGMIGHALRNASAGAVYIPGQNQNMYESLVMQLTRLTGRRHVVLEVSGGAASRIEKRARSLGADVSIVTSIAEVHLAKGEGVKDVAIRKSSIFHGSPPGGVAIINIDTPCSDFLVDRALGSGRRVITYGESSHADIRLVNYDPLSLKARVKVEYEEIEYVLGAAGKHMAINSLAVIAVLRAYQIENWREGVKSLADFQPLEGRGMSSSRTLAGHRVKLIDESYNANPASMRTSLEYLETTPFAVSGRKVALLGDMLELGDESANAHGALLPSVKAAGLDLVILFGEEMEALAKNLEGYEGLWFYWRTLDEATDTLPRLLQNGDVVLAKASKATGLASWLKDAQTM